MTEGCADCEFLQHETDGDFDTCPECANEETDRRLCRLRIFNDMETMLDQVFAKVLGANW